MLSSVLAMAGFALAGAITPGPVNVLALRHGNGRAGAAFCYVLGASLSYALIVWLMGQSGQWLLKQPELLRWAPRICALYLLWLAWLSFRAGASLALTGGGAAPFPGYAALYRRGIVMNVTNPKVSLFFLAFLPQFCDPARGSVALQVLSLGLLFMLATLVVFLSVTLLGGRLALWFNKARHGQILIHRAAGLVFACLALFLLFSGK